MKGSIVWASPGSNRLLGYSPDELIDGSLSDICHPNDLSSLLREFKEARQAYNSRKKGHSGPIGTVTVLYRAKKVDGSYVWVEGRGSVVTDEGRIRKCVVLVNRKTELPQLRWTDVDAAKGLGRSDCWARISPTGLLFHLSPDIQSILGFSPSDLVGTTLQQLCPESEWSSLEGAISHAFQGTSVSLTHRLLNRQRQAVTVVSDFYARSGGGTGRGRSYISCQINSLESSASRISPGPVKRQRTEYLSSSSKSLVFLKTPREDRIFDDLCREGASNHHVVVQQARALNRQLKEDLAVLEAARDRAREARANAGGPSYVYGGSSNDGGSTDYPSS